MYSERYREKRGNAAMNVLIAVVVLLLIGKTRRQKRPFIETEWISSLEKMENPYDCCSGWESILNRIPVDLCLGHERPRALFAVTRIRILIDSC